MRATIVRLALVVAFAAMAVSSTATAERTVDPLTPPPAPKPVTRIVWADTADFRKTLAQTSEPLVVIDSPGVQWATSGAWSPAGLAQRAPSVLAKDVCTQSSPLFVRSDGADARALNGSWAGLDVSSACTWSNATMTELATALAAPSSSSFIRWSGALDTFAPEDSVFARELGSREWLLDANDARLTMRSASAREPLHYNTFNELVVQLHGHSRVILHAPQFELAAHVFPAIHPSYYSSQLDSLGPDEPDALRYPYQAASRASMRVLQAELAPGDALFVPAFFFHGSVAERGATVTLATASSSHALESTLANVTQLFELPVPGLDASLTRVQSAFAIKIFIEVIDALVASENWAPAKLSLSQLVVDGRYKPLFGLRVYHEELVASICPWVRKGATAPMDADDVNDMLVTMVRAVGGEFGQLAGQLGTIRLMTLAHYVETLVRSAVASVHQMPGFMQECMPHRIVSMRDADETDPALPGYEL